tara:strand:+ start:214 stop:1143 length:930 start_codon:yes stop_codon:yes gene_type:complete
MTAKHKMLTNANEKTPKTAKAFMCSCGKVYKQAPSLTRHKKKCTYIEEDDTDSNDDTICEHDTVVNEIDIIPSLPNNTHISDSVALINIIKENQEFKNLMVEQFTHLQGHFKEQQEQIKESHKDNMEMKKQMIDAVKNTNNITNNTTNNTQFNLNFFLNDTCKDAMNITDFLGNMNVNIDEIEYIGHHGYVNGMTKMIMDRLKEMDITKRPIHCTDIKRETMYIKDQNEWCKDTDELTKLRKILTRITMNNYRTVPQWKTAHPKSEEMDTRDYNFCYKMMRVILGDVEEEQVRLDNKIIKTMAKGLFCK